MQELLIAHYLWLKSFHVIAVVSWMAGLLYLPRLFAYHADPAITAETAQTFTVMESRLYRYIMRPAMIATWAFGGAMLYANWEAIMAMGWMHAKLALVLALTGLHHVFGAWRKKLAAGQNTKAPKFYKIWNEAPTLILVMVVILVIVKPF